MAMYEYACYESRLQILWHRCDLVELMMGTRVWHVSTLRLQWR